MGAKGLRRREKNYRAAHGGNARLPPPPDPSAVDALPSKLRQLLALTSSSSRQASKGDSETAGKREKGAGSSNRKTVLPAAGSTSTQAGVEDGGGHIMAPQHSNGSDVSLHNDSLKNKNKKRKRKKSNDLQLEAALEGLGAAGSKKRERRKKYLEAKKKKGKKTYGGSDFPGCEVIKFGEVVAAPPKLRAIPKAPKTVGGASQERLRLQTVAAYRDRKGWASRPGIKLPPPLAVAAPSS